MRFIFPIIISIITVHLGTGILVYLLILFGALYCLEKGDNFYPLAFYFVLVYILPYGLNSLVLKQPWGGVLDNNFLAAIPIYVTIPLYLNKNFPLNKKLQLILSLFIISALVSSIVPGALSLLGLGGYNVYFPWTLHYISSLLVGVLAYTVFLYKNNITRFTNLIMFLGIISAVGGLLQYTFGFLFFLPNAGYDLSRLFIVPIPEAVSSIPYFIIPLVFGLNQLDCRNIQRKTLAYLTVFILTIASLLTWSRWGFLVILLLIMTHFIISGKKLTFLLAGILIALFIFFLISNFSLTDILPSDQKNRLSTGTSLFGRFMLWGMALNLLTDVWLLGVGIGNTVKFVFSYTPHPIFAKFYYTGFNFDIMQSIHSFFLDWWINQGILAMFGLTGLYYYVIKHFRSVEKYFKDEVVRRFSRSILLSLIGLTLFYSQNSGDGYHYLFMFLGASFAIRKLIIITYGEKIKNKIITMKPLL